MIPMTNNSLFRNEISDDKSESKQITTLPAVVTLCLASCSECCGEYIDSTSSFRICCLCPCGHKLSYSNKTRSQNEKCSVGRSRANQPTSSRQCRHQRSRTSETPICKIIAEI